MLIYVHVVTNFKHTFMIYHNFMNDSNLDPSLTTPKIQGPDGLRFCLTGTSVKIQEKKFITSVVFIIKISLSI